MLSYIAVFGHPMATPWPRLCCPETVQHIRAGCKLLACRQSIHGHHIKVTDILEIVHTSKCDGNRLSQIQIDKPDIVLVVDKQQKEAIVIDVAIHSDSNIRKEEHTKLEKYTKLKRELLISVEQQRLKSSSYLLLQISNLSQNCARIFNSLDQLITVLNGEHIEQN